MNKKTQKNAGPAEQLKIGALFEQELQLLNEDLKRQAALSMFYKLQPNNRITVEEFLNGIKQHKEVWAVVSSMGMVDFASALITGNKRDLRTKEELSFNRRTRLSEQQKQALKQIIVDVLAQNGQGLNRNDIAKSVTSEQTSSLGIEHRELANKLRQPLGELVSGKKVGTIGAKRLMKYTLAPEKAKR